MDTLVYSGAPSLQNWKSLESFFYFVFVVVVVVVVTCSCDSQGSVTTKKRMTPSSLNVIDLDTGISE